MSTEISSTAFLELSEATSGGASRATAGCAAAVEGAGGRVWAEAGWGLGRMVVRGLLAPFYHLTTIGREWVPERGGAILVANHPSYLDVLLVAAASPRSFRVLGWEGLRNSWWLRQVFRLAGVIPVAPGGRNASLTEAVRHLRRGGLLVIFPEGALTPDGRIQPFHRGFAVLAERAGVPIQPVGLGGMWGSRWSHAHPREASAWPWRRRPVRVAFGQARPARFWTTRTAAAEVAALLPSGHEPAAS